MAASRKLIDENAQLSCEFLYEICDRRAAFGTHLPSPHLAAFNTTSGDLVMNENVAKLDLIFEGSNNRR
jgi:hypothetical protein